METLKVLGVDCNNCATNVRKALEGVNGIEKLDIRLSEKVAVVTFDPDKVSKQEITERVEDFGYDVEY
ncbi:MAG: heavy metal-associated domain-containing protein [Methanosarcina sp.]|jgi:copper chaperone CopZ|nr:heavy metal-associated domain-containing protein [Methanosarcina sp.]MDD3317809.1 heavy metal-associated domain-containing protein [Methanosarcina sp.]MDD4306178.1 heavy metal-associated domain-containing protein [Methanosarcina sp.]MDD4620726.1 heavy metal-associated domain-containing protein [Methanosarcina sp.]